jgi:hypothetical protein
MAEGGRMPPGIFSTRQGAGSGESSSADHRSAQRP